MSATFPRAALAATGLILLTTSTLVSANNNGGSMSSAPSMSTPDFDAATEYRNGIEALKANKFADAKKAFGNVLQVASTDANANFLAGLADAGLNDLKSAAKHYERATKANLPYPIIDAQAAGMVAAWQILEAGVNGAKSLEDKQIAAWLKKNVVTTVYGPTKFDGLYNHGEPAQLIRQVQDKQWKVIWPKQFVAPGVKLIAT